KAAAYFEDAAALRKRLEAVEARGWDNQTLLDKATAEIGAGRRALEEERAKAAAAAEEAAARALAREAELRARLAAADRVEVERVGLQQELAQLRSRLAEFDGLRQERDAARDALEESKAEAASLRHDVARLEKEQESQREKTIIVTSDLEEIEQRHQSE